MTQLPSETIPARLKGIFVLPLFLTGVWWLLSVSGSFPRWKLFLTAGGLLYMFFSFFLLKAKTLRIANTLVLLAAIHFGYLLLESGVYIQECFYRSFLNISVFDRPCAVFDPAFGYRWIGKKSRNVRILYGKVVANAQFAINRQGFISRQDYFTKKTDLSSKRYIIFGDSFTAATYLHTSWPDKIATMLNSKKMKRRYEFYSFAVNGGGLVNWHTIFFKNITSHFEFDGLILAICGDDLYRNFSILDMDPTGGYFGRFATQPSDLADYKSNYFPRMKKIFQIMPDQKIDELVSFPQKLRKWPLAPPNTYALRRLWDFISGRINTFTGKPPTGYLKSPDVLKFTDVEIKIGKEKLALLDEIFTWCRQNKKEVRLVYIPTLQDLMLKAANASGVPAPFAELIAISRHYEIPYYDGSSAFYGLSQTALKRHWLLHDGHWNQAGSDLFAHALAKHLNRTPSKGRVDGAGSLRDRN